MSKIDIAKVTGILGMVLSVGATIVNSIAQKEQIAKAAEEAVAKALNN